jgi:type IV pilus assembly protein PilB
MAGRLGDILVQQGAITQAQLEGMLAAQGSEKGMLGTIMVRRGMISDDQLGAALQEQFEVPFHRIAPESVNTQLVRLLPESLLRSRQFVPIDIVNGNLQVAMVAPDDIEAIAETELITGYAVEPVVSLQHEVMSTLDAGFDDKIVARQTIVDMKMTEMSDAAKNPLANAGKAETDANDEAPVVRLVRSILMGAINAKVSDIHLEPHLPQMRVRYRVDGELQQVMTIPNHIEEAVVARIKVMADMDTTETRKPQDGHLAIDDAGGKASLRVSTIPTVGGEKVVMRVLDDGNKTFRFDSLGLSPRNVQVIERLIGKPHGMIVITGPTGSGKSTTMYTMLSQINSVDTNIVTVEDPVEYRLPGINQVAADAQHGLGFANALKYIMRQDPDVIMVGEIRDHETAQTAVQAALTGHLLISTLHTNDAVGAIARLNDLGIDPFKIGGALLGCLAQRLLRSICPDCKEPCEANEKLLKSLLKDRPMPKDVTFFHGRGCKKCLGSGYSGRIPIIEIMEVTPAIAEAIEKGTPHTVLKKLAIEEGMVELEMAGLEQACAGKTTIEEVFYKVSS